MFILVINSNHLVTKSYFLPIHWVVCKFLFLSWLDHYFAEEHATRLTERSKVGFTAESEQVADGQQLNGVALHQWGVVPDVVEGQAGKLTAPAERHGQTTQNGQDLVAAIDGTVETFVSVPPNTVDGTNTIWLSKNLFELNLNVGV